MVGGAHHCDGNPDPDIAAHRGVRLPPLGGEVAGQVFQSGLCLNSYEYKNQGNEWRKHWKY